ncbi:MAG: hypothetical protein ACREJB_17105, partial [Planctomycetaceae bacterium]
VTPSSFRVAHEFRPSVGSRLMHESADAVFLIFPQFFKNCTPLARGDFGSLALDEPFADTAGSWLIRIGSVSGARFSAAAQRELLVIAAHGAGVHCCVSVRSRERPIKGTNVRVWSGPPIFIAASLRRMEPA